MGNDNTIKFTSYFRDSINLAAGHGEQVTHFLGVEVDRHILS
jgi:hypothetical protein